MVACDRHIYIYNSSGLHNQQVCIIGTKEIENMKQRLTYFDQAKGVAILLVVMGHVMQFSFGYEHSSVVDMLGVFHMPVFFLISGFFAYNVIPSFCDLRQKIVSRGRALLIPYFVFLALWSVFSGGDFVHELLGGGGRYWFLWCLLVLSVFFLVWEYIIGRVKNIWISIGLWLLPYIVLIGLKIKGIEIGGNLLIISHIVTYYRYYLIGYMCKKYVPFNKLLFENEIVYAFAFILYFVQWHLCDRHNMLLILAGGIGAIIVLLRLLKAQSENNSAPMRLLTYIGQNSLAIYVIHYFFIPDVSNVMHLYLEVQNPLIW